MESETKVYSQFHPISEVGEISDVLNSVFENSGIKTLEQAVGFLCTAAIDVEGKEDFLMSARGAIGEEAFQKYSTPVEHPPLGCDEPEPHVKTVIESPLPDDSACADKKNDAGGLCPSERSDSPSEDERAGGCEAGVKR